MPVPVWGRPGKWTGGGPLHMLGAETATHLQPMEQPGGLALGPNNYNWLGPLSPEWQGIGEESGKTSATLLSSPAARWSCRAVSRLAARFTLFAGEVRSDDEDVPPSPV